MMNLLCGRRDLVPSDHVGVVKNAAHERTKMRVADSLNGSAQLHPHLLGISLRGWKVVGEIYLRIVDPLHLMNRQLRTIMKYLNQAFDFDEIVSLERLEDLTHVIKHLRVELTSAVGEQER